MGAKRRLSVYNAPKRARVTKRKRKIVLRKKRNIRYRNSISAGLGFPKTMVMTHKYSEFCQLAGPGKQSFNWAANNMYDPNVSGTGHQPMYFDQMCALYNHWTVIGAKIVVRPAAAVGNNQATKITAYLNDDAVVVGDIDAAIEQATAKTVRVVPANSTNPIKPFVLKYSAKKNFKGSILGNDDMHGTATSGPTETMNWTIIQTALDGVSNVNFYYQVEIYYIAVWTEKKDMGSS